MATEISFSMEKRNEMKRLKALIKKEDEATVGIGTMIIFIAMVLVAAVAASVLISTSYTLQIQAQKTGRDTISEVSVGVKIIDICGQYSTRVVDSTSYSRIHNMTLTITPRAGSKAIDLSETLVVITNGDSEYVLKTNSTLPVLANKSSHGTVFNKKPENHPKLSTVFDLPSREFGIIVVKDFDNSCRTTIPVINKGDKVMLTINITALFNGIPERTQIWGKIITEEGISSNFDFKTPVGFKDIVIDL
jgi:flagellin FlaB